MLENGTFYEGATDHRFPRSHDGIPSKKSLTRYELLASSKQLILNWSCHLLLATGTCGSPREGRLTLLKGNPIRLLENVTFYEDATVHRFPCSRDGIPTKKILTRYGLLATPKLRIWSFRTRHVWFRTRFVRKTLIYLCSLSRYHDGLRCSQFNVNLIFERFRARYVSVFKGRC